MAQALRTIDVLFKDSAKPAASRGVDDVLEAVRILSSRPITKDTDLDQMVETINDIHYVFDSKEAIHFNKKNAKGHHIGISFSGKPVYLCNTENADGKKTLYLYASNSNNKTTTVTAVLKGANTSSEILITKLNTLYENDEIITYTDGHF